MIRSTPIRVVVQETHGNWAGLLRHQLAADNIAVIRVENLDQLSDELKTAKRACFALQIAQPSAIDHLNWLRDASRGYPDACFCGIVSDDDQRADAWAVYEAGAALVIRHPLEIPSFARLVRRFFAARSQMDTAGSEFTIESVWLSLPWRNHATPAFDTWTNREE